MPTALYRYFLALLLLLPFAAHASDAEDFLNANPMQQAKLLQDWAAQPDPARIELVDALQHGQLTLNGETKTVRLNNRLRGLLDNVQASQQLLAADPKVRLGAAQTLQKTAQPAQLKFLDQQVAAETNEDVHTALSLALANLQLVDTDPVVRLAAVRLLGSTGDPLARTRLEALLAPGVETDAAVHTAAETSLAQVKRKLMVGDLLGQAFSGLSLGSILLLAALGLAITFGLLGVINMAHGEMLMLGAYSTYVVQLLMQRYVPAAIEFYPLIALPVNWDQLDNLKPQSGGPLLPVMSTLCIAAGRKDKVRPGDILGALTGEAGIPGAQVGKIAIFDFQAFVAVERGIAKQALQRLNDGKIKGRSLRVRIL